MPAQSHRISSPVLVKRKIFLKYYIQLIRMIKLLKKKTNRTDMINLLCYFGEIRFLQTDWITVDCAIANNLNNYGATLSLLITLWTDLS